MLTLGEVNWALIKKIIKEILVLILIQVSQSHFFKHV